MRNTAAPLLARIHSLFNHDLAAENDYLRAENRVLRELIPEKRPRLTERHRRLLVKYGMLLKDRLAEVISIVKPETLLAWNRRMKRRKWDYSYRRRKTGRPPKADATEALVVKLAEDNTWGYVRIVGELAKMGHVASPSYVRNILKKHGLPPSPHRKGLSWKTFIQSHMDVTWATDFFTEEVWTQTGLTNHLRAVLRPPQDPPDSHFGLQAESECGLDAPAGAEFLHDCERTARQGPFPCP